MISLLFALCPSLVGSAHAQEPPGVALASELAVNVMAQVAIGAAALPALPPGGLALAPEEGEAAPAPAPADVPAEPPAADTQIGTTRPFLMEVNVRGRYMWMPSSILDIWYEKHDTAGDTVPERPGVAAYALGLEYVIRDRQANGIFYLEYVNSLIEEGYWDDRDNPPEYDDGSYIKPEFFGLVVVGADYGYELHAQPWLSFLFGAGLGVGVKTGNLVEWEPGEDPLSGDSDNTDPTCGPAGTPAYDRYSQGCADDGPIRVPPVLPVVDVNIGVRFNFSDRSSLRIEGGLHDLPYAGASLGITF